MLVYVYICIVCLHSLRQLYRSRWWAIERPMVVKTAQ
eukprot:SAG22_NODE_15556_length_346_cov_0.627530_1_plen_36_part_10